MKKQMAKDIDQTKDYWSVVSESGTTLDTDSDRGQMAKLLNECRGKASLYKHSGGVKSFEANNHQQRTSSKAEGSMMEAFKKAGLVK